MTEEEPEVTDEVTRKDQIAVDSATEKELPEEPSEPEESDSDETEAEEEVVPEAQTSKPAETMEAVIDETTADSGESSAFDPMESNAESGVQSEESTAEEALPESPLMVSLREWDRELLETLKSQVVTEEEPEVTDEVTREDQIAVDSATEKELPEEPSEPEESDSDETEAEEEVVPEAQTSKPAETMEAVIDETTADSGESSAFDPMESNAESGVQSEESTAEEAAPESPLMVSLREWDRELLETLKSQVESTDKKDNKVVSISDLYTIYSSKEVDSVWVRYQPCGSEPKLTEFCKRINNILVYSKELYLIDDYIEASRNVSPAYSDMSVLFDIILKEEKEKESKDDNYRSEKDIYIYRLAGKVPTILENGDSFESDIRRGTWRVHDKLIKDYCSRFINLVDQNNLSRYYRNFKINFYSKIHKRGVVSDFCYISNDRGFQTSRDPDDWYEYPLNSHRNFHKVTTPNRYAVTEENFVVSADLIKREYFTMHNNTPIVNKF